MARLCALAGPLLCARCGGRVEDELREYYDGLLNKALPDRFSGLVELIAEAVTRQTEHRRSDHGTSTSAASRGVDRRG